MTTDQTIFPTINEDDDVFKVMIKTAIIDNRINLVDLRTRFANQYAMHNMITNLNSPSSDVTLRNFALWCQVLDLQFTFKIENHPQGVLKLLEKPIEIKQADDGGI